MPVVGPHTEYHYIAEAVAHGPWSVTNFESDGDEREVVSLGYSRWSSTGQEIWIYTADDKATDLVEPPLRNSLANESNYRARVSVPRSFAAATKLQHDEKTAKVAK